MGEERQHILRCSGLVVIGWRDAQHQVFGAACETLEQVWPEMLAELSVVVRQVALLLGECDACDISQGLRQGQVAIVQRSRLAAEQAERAEGAGA